MPHVAIEMGFSGLPRHRKIARDLGVSRFEAAAWEMHLKDLALRHARDGRLSVHYDPADIAEELEYPRAKKMFNAFVRHGVLTEEGDLAPACWANTQNGRYVEAVDAERERSARRRQAKRDAEARAEETAQGAQGAPPVQAPEAPVQAPEAPVQAPEAPVDAPEAPEAPAAAAPALALAPEPDEGGPTDEELLEQLTSKDPKCRNRPKIEAQWRKMDRSQKIWAVRARRHLNGTKYQVYRQSGEERYIPYLDSWLRRQQWTEVPLEKLQPRKPPRRAEQPAPSPEAEARSRNMFARRGEIREELRRSGKYQTGAELDAAIESAMEREFSTGQVATA